MQKTGNKRYYGRQGLVTRPVHLSPEEAEAIRQAAFARHISQQQWMREVLTAAIRPAMLYSEPASSVSVYPQSAAQTTRGA